MWLGVWQPSLPEGLEVTWCQWLVLWMEQGSAPAKWSGVWSLRRGWGGALAALTVVSPAGAEGWASLEVRGPQWLLLQQILGRMAGSGDSASSSSSLTVGWCSGLGGRWVGRQLQQQAG